MTNKTTKSAKNEAASTGGGLDMLLLFAAAAIALSGFYVFYQLEGELLSWLRVLGLLVVLVLASLIAGASVRGKQFFSFMRASYTEVQKVVWPTRGETVQTTIAVLVVVALSGVIIWIFDWFFGFLVSTLVA